MCISDGLILWNMQGNFGEYHKQWGMLRSLANIFLQQMFFQTLYSYIFILHFTLK